MYDRVLVITINSYYSKVPSTGTAVHLRSTVPTSEEKLLQTSCYETKVYIEFVKSRFIRPPAFLGILA